VNLASVWKFVKEWAKTLAAFVAGVVANMIVNLVNGGAVWPQTKAEWTQYVLTSFGAAIAVSLTRNKITQKQLDKDPNVIGGVVVPDAQVPPATTYQAPVAGAVYMPPWPKPQP
jgi:uncharacterized membrane protein YjjP (DUF1212 family)